MKSRAATLGWLVLLSVLAATGILGAAIVKTDALALAVFPAILAASIIIWRPELGLLFMAFLLPFEDATLFAGGATITKAAGMLVAGAWLLQKLARRESWQNLVTSMPLRLVTLLVGLAWLSTLWAQWPQVVFPRVVRLIMLFALCVIALDLARRWSQLEHIARAMVAGGIVGAGMVILQYSTGLVRRAGQSVAGDVNSTAMILVVLVPFAFVLIRTRGPVLWRILGLVYVGLAVIAVSQTLSRMSYIMLALVMAWELWMALRTPRSRLASVLVLALVVGLGARFVPLEAVRDRAETIIPYVESTLSTEATGTGALSGRGFHLAVGAALFRDHPILGVGYANFGQYFLQYQFEVAGAGGTLYRSPRSAHSAYMAWLAELGIVGAVLWVPFLLIVGIRLIRALAWMRGTGAQDHRLVAKAIGVSLAIFLAYGFYAEFQLQKSFWLLAGLALAVDALVGEARTVQAPGETTLAENPGIRPHGAPGKGYPPDTISDSRDRTTGDFPRLVH